MCDCVTDRVVERGGGGGFGFGVWGLKFNAHTKKCPLSLAEWRAGARTVQPS